MDDSAILDRFFERSENAIMELSAKYGRICLNTAEKITLSQEDAQECVNDAYLGVWNVIPPERPNPLLAYVLRIVRNISINRVRYNNAAMCRGRYQECLDELDGNLSTRETPEDAYGAKLLSSYNEEFLLRADLSDAQYENVSTLLPYISGIRLTKEQIYQLANDPQVGWMGSIWTAYNAVSTQTRATDSLYLHIHPRRKPGVNV